VTLAPPKGVELVVRVGVAGGVELVRALGQLVGALEVELAGGRDGEAHAEGGEELFLRALERRLRLLPRHVGAVELPPLRRVGGDEARLQLRQLAQRGEERGVEGVDLRQRVLDLGALEGLVVDQADAVERDVDLLGDLAQAAHLRAPVDLRVEEVLVDAERAQPRQRVLVVVAAGDRLQDAALVERPQRFADAGPQLHVVPFGEDAVPQRPVEIPDDDFENLPLQPFSRLT
jgi:hypothetical protein